MFVTKHAAMKIGRSLVITDLHIGIEYEILKSGINVRQVDDLIERTNKLLKITKANNLIILGDIKHNVPFLEKEERISVPLFLNEIGKKASITIIPGNHDGSLVKLCPKGVKIEESSGIVIGKYGLLHGHAKPCKEMEKADTIVIGHNHPLFMFTDKVGAKTFRQVWIVGKDIEGRKIIIMPAFSRLVGGAAINNIKSEKELLGPVAKHILLKDADIFMLDGTCLGKFRDLNKR